MKRAALSMAIAMALPGCANNAAPRLDGGSDAEPEVTPSAEAGAVALAMRQCGQCHQSNNPADGALSGQATPIPGSQAYGSNLTPDPDTGMDAWDAGTIANSILQGIDPLGKPLCPQMPRYADAGMVAAEAFGIALYLQHLPPARHLVPASVCPPLKNER